MAEAESKVPMVAGNRGLQLNSLDEMYRFAKAVKASKFCPKDMQDEASILIAVEMGMELGLPAMQALQNIAVINGRPSVWGDAMLGLVLQSGLCVDFEEYAEGESGKEDYGWVCRVQRQGFKPTKRKFTVKGAKQAGLWGKTGPWTTSPDRMLQMRARGFALRDAFPDVLKGLSMAEVSVDDNETIDVTPVTGEATETEQVKEQVETLKEKAKDKGKKHEEVKKAEVVEPEGDNEEGLF